MGYYRRPNAMSAYAGLNSTARTELIDRIEKVAARGVTTLTDWERKFLGSLLESAKKWGRLTAKQHEVYQRIEKKSDPKHIAASKVWNDGFTDDMRAKLEFAALYYKANPPYFCDVADRILSNPDYMPTEKLYRKMVENKYVQRAMQNNDEAPKYEVGSMVTVRDSCHVQGRIAAHRGKMVMIISVAQDVKSATKGSRKVTILPVGSGEVLVTEERYLKRAKKV